MCRVKYIKYVQKTREIICMDDAAADNRFSDSKDTNQAAHKSLICFPLILQNKLIGILFLTNDLAKGVFSPDRIEILKILSSGIAGALENARLYKQLADSNITLEKKVKERTKELELIARTDSLTKLQNRRSFLETIEYEKRRCLRENKTFAVILADIDNFKLINDNHGHDYGDYVLKHLSGLLKTTIRDQDTVARWGGEEFIFLLPETLLDGGRKSAKKIRRAVEKMPFLYNNTSLTITMTFGISHFDGSLSIDDCIKTADQNLYSGKRSGKNKVV